MIWFTSDLHFNDYRVIDFCNRPFKSVVDMNEGLIKRWNSIVKPEDTVYVVGDFILDSFGLKYKAPYFESRLNGKLIYVEGNHDVNNMGGILPKKIYLEFDRKKWVVQHIPPTEGEVISGFHYICGHVHTEYKTLMINDSIIINVSSDIWNYYPIQLGRLVKEANRALNRAQKMEDK